MTEDWNAMTAAMNSSPNHVSNAERWAAKAREANPALDDEQAHRLGDLLKREHYARMGRISAESRRRARAAASEQTAAET